MQDATDEVFTQIAGRAGSLDVLLDQFFGFLHRRTDLYVTFDPKGSRANMGFPEGIAEKMVLERMRKFPYRTVEDVQRSQGSSGDQVRGRHSGKAGGNTTNIGATSVNSSVGKTHASISSSSPSPLSSTTTSSSSSTPPPPPHGTGAAVSPGGGVPDNVNSGNTGQDQGGRTHSGTPATGAGAGSDVAPSSHRQPGLRTEDGKLIPIGNGGFTDIYYWTQSLEELTVYIDVPSGTRGRDVKCDIHTAHMKLVVNGIVLMEGSFDGTVIADECMWTMSADGGCSVIIHMEKRRKTWWKCVLEGDDEIDCTKVDSTRKIGEYDEATQGTIRKIQHDERQRRLGLPTSEEETMDKIFEKAKMAPGSPFLDNSR